MKLNFDKDHKQSELNLKLTEHKLLKHGGTVFPVSLTPCFLSSKKYNELSNHCENILSAIQKLLEYYQNNQDIQEYYQEFDKYRYLTLTIPRYKPWVQYARFDIAIDNLWNFYLMETNTACPGGAVIVPKIKKIYESLNLSFSDKNFSQIIHQPIDEETFFIKSIVNTYKKLEGKEPKHIGFGFNNFRPIKSDLEQLVEVSKKLGFSAEIFDINDIKIKNNKIFATHNNFDLIHHKFDILTEESGQQRPCLFKTHPKETETYYNALKDNLFIGVNSLPSMTLAESKKIIPALLDKKYQALFSEEEIESIKKLCLPTQALVPDYNVLQTVRYSDILKNKNEYVIKYAYDTRSRGVFIGKEMSNMDWNKCLESTRNIPSVAQKYIENLSEDILSPISNTIVSCRTNIAIYLINGKAAGLLCRSSQGYKSNFYADGVYRPIYVTE